MAAAGIGRCAQGGGTENTLPVEPPHNDPNYFFEKDMADHAIRWMQTQKAAAPDKPFFVYYAPGLSHTPHHAPAEWIAKFKGQFDQGWDKLREETFARQKQLGVVPAGAQLTPRPLSLPAWDSLKPEQKKVYSRLMEIYAATVAYSDFQTGRLIDAVKASGQFDNTLIVYIEGDTVQSRQGFHHRARPFQKES